MKTDMKSILRLDKVVFDKIEFDRLGFKNDTELKLEIQTNIGERKDKAAYKVTVIAIGKKPDEYTFHISITGYFTFRTEDVETDLKNELIKDFQSNTIEGIKNKDFRNFKIQFLK